MKKIENIQHVFAGVKKAQAQQGSLEIKTDQDFKDLLLRLEDKSSGKKIIDFIKENKELEDLIKDYGNFCQGYRMVLNLYGS